MESYFKFQYFTIFYSIFEQINAAVLLLKALSYQKLIHKIIKGFFTYSY